jgi:hypothetical protein
MLVAGSQAPAFFSGVTVNYTRALFGTLPDCEDFNLGVGDPIPACGAIRVVAGNLSLSKGTTGAAQATVAVGAAGDVDLIPTVRMAVVVDRGGCRFEDKAGNVANAGGTFAIVGNQANAQVRGAPCQWDAWLCL